MKNIVKQLFADKAKRKMLVLSVLLAGLVMAIVYLSSQLLFSSNVRAIDFSHLTEQEAISWAKKEKIDSSKVKITHQYSESVPKGILILQKPLKEKMIDDVLQLVYSSGPDPKAVFVLPKLTAKMTRQDLEKWFKEKRFSDVSYEYVLDEEHAKDEVIKLNVAGSVSRDAVILVTLSAGNDADNVEITVPDFSKYSKENIDAWGNANLITIRYNTVYDNALAKGKVLGQEPQKGAIVKPGQTIHINIAGGKTVQVEDFYGKTPQNVRTWAKNNGIELIFEDSYSEEVAAGYVIGTSPKANTNIALGESLRVFVSLGQDPKNKKVTVGGSYLGKSENEFKDYLRSLGLAFQKTSVSYYSSTIAKGHVYAYEDGTFTADKVITYSLSRGPYVYEATKIEGQNQKQAEAYVQEVNNLNGHLSLRLQEVYDERTTGTVFSCSLQSSGASQIVSCSVSLGPKPITYTLENYVGKQNPCAENYCSIADGHITLAIEYQISSQPEGQVLAQSVAPGEVADGTHVVLTVAKAQEKFYIPSIEDLDASAGNDAQETIHNLESVLSSFTNKSFSVTASRDYTKGHVISVSVDGNSSYDAGYYPADVHIEILVSDGYE